MITMLTIFAHDLAPAGPQMLDRWTLVNVHLHLVRPLHHLDTRPRLRSEERAPIARDRVQPSVPPLPVNRLEITAPQFFQVTSPGLHAQSLQQEAERRIDRVIEIW